MRRRTAAIGQVPPWAMAVAAMVSIQLGSALSVELIDTAGPAGTAWLRLTMGAVLLVALARPRLRAIRRADMPALLGLGVATGVMTMSFLAAIERIPLGTAVAIEFLGPLTVAAVRSHNAPALAWPALALLGIVLLTEPWHGSVNLPGVGFAVLAGGGWGTYIVLTQHVGDRFSGITSLAFTIPIAAAFTAILGVPQATGHLTAEVLAAALGLAVLVPVLPFALEMLALRRMTHAAFGTLMALEPAIGTLLGLVVLSQNPSITQLVGITIVVLAAMAAQRNGWRHLPGGPQGEGGAHPTAGTHPGAAQTDSVAAEQMNGRPH